MRRKREVVPAPAATDPLRLGVIVRADDRGLAHLTQEFARHTKPQRVLVVDMHDPRFPFRPDGGYFPGAEQSIVDYVEGGGLSPAHVVEDFLTGLTHVYTAETPYDPMLFERARSLGVASICHVMPEFDKFTGQPPTLRPSAMWLPTCWRADQIPGSTVVPIPAPVAPRPRQRTEANTFVHIIGSRARPDRGGWLAVSEAIRQGSGNGRWIIYVQDGAGALPSSLRRMSNVELRAGSVPDRWSLYDDADVLVAPRRFGGLSLPVLEAAASGVVVLTLDNDPMGEYAAVQVLHKPAGSFESPGGDVTLSEADPVDLANAIADLRAGAIDMPTASDWTYRRAWANRWPEKAEGMLDLVREVKP